MFVLPKSSDPTTFLKDGGNYFSDCSKERMVSISLECKVEAGSLLLVRNVVDHPIEINIKAAPIYDKTPPTIWDPIDLTYDKDWLDSVWEMFH